MRWDDNLTGPARQIAATNHSPLRVLAGPGTGKTFAMMRRIARLLSDGAAPRRMFICTFTRTAASDLSKRYCRLAPKAADRVRAGTLHAYCFKLLDQKGLDADWSTPAPLLTFEERFLLQDHTVNPLAE